MDRPLTFLDVGDTVREHLRDPGSVVFGDAERIDAERFRQMILNHVEKTGEAAGVYRVDDDAGTLSVLLPSQGGWWTYSMRDVAEASYLSSNPILADDQREAMFMDGLRCHALSPEPETVELYASRPITESDFIPGDDIEEMDNLLNFYLHVNCDVDELFGTHVGTDANNSYLNVYANYNMDTGRVTNYLDITLCRGDGVDIPMRYRLSDDERSMRLTKMRDYCQHCGTPLDEWRERYLAEQKADAGPAMGIGQTM